MVPIHLKLQVFFNQCNVENTKFVMLFLSFQLIAAYIADNRLKIGIIFH